MERWLSSHHGFRKAYNLPLSPGQQTTLRRTKGQRVWRKAYATTQTSPVYMASDLRPIRVVYSKARSQNEVEKHSPKRIGRKVATRHLLQTQKGLLSPELQSISHEHLGCPVPKRATDNGTDDVLATVYLTEYTGCPERSSPER